MKGEWCPERKVKFCQEGDCSSCSLHTERDGDRIVEEWRVAESLQVLECLAANRDVLRAQVWLELYRQTAYHLKHGGNNQN